MVLLKANPRGRRQCMALHTSFDSPCLASQALTKQGALALSHRNANSLSACDEPQDEAARDGSRSRCSGPALRDTLCSCPVILSVSRKLYHAACHLGRPLNAQKSSCCPNGSSHVKGINDALPNSAVPNQRAQQQNGADTDMRPVLIQTPAARDRATARESAACS
jgi:hypothetical protein